MKILVASMFLTFYCSCISSSNQSSPAPPEKVVVGGPCDGCNLMFEGLPSLLSYVDTLPDWYEAGSKMELSGTVYRKDGKTPAENVILYFYHTDNKGYYTPAANQTAGLRHGHIRGWIKTNSTGAYKIYTNKPVAYPGTAIPAHIHCTVKESEVNEYYIDEYEFDDDPLLTHEIELKREKRGGSGIIKLNVASAGLLIGHRDIVLGLNIPDYNQ